MRFQVGRSLHYYYVTLIIFTLILFGAGSKYFWDNGPFNSENVRASYEASMKYDDLSERKPLKAVESLISTDRSREGINKLIIIEKNIAELDNYGHVESIDELNIAIKQSKRYLNQLISYPQMTSVISVLSNKVTSFEDYVSENSWKTLTRISRRLKASVSGRVTQTPGFFSLSKLRILSKNFQSEIKRMEKITLGSVLSDLDKQNIVTKLRTFDTEVKMLERYVQSLKSLKTSFRRLKKKYNIWLTDLAPEITLAKIQMEKNTRHMALGLVGVVTFLFLGLLGGLLLNRRYRRKSKEALESNILKVIQEGLIPIENKLNFEGTTDFKREFDRYREYFHKRISFGSVFQEAVPFSSILLDSNLNISWANELFYQHWNLEDTHHNGGSVSWDYLQQYTNLGDDDPVMMALKQGIAGIYQIQVRNPKNTAEVLPYEMYVSPVEYSGLKRIMIFFYPLRSLEETISEQSKSIVSPVSKTIEALQAGHFKKDLREKLQKDYDIAGIGEVYEKFVVYGDTIEKMKMDYITEIQNLELSIQEQNDVIEDLEGFSVRKANLNDTIKSDFENSKNAIIHTIDLRGELETLFNKVHDLTNGMLKQEHILLEGTKNSNRVIDENFKAFDAVSRTKEDFKELKHSMDDLRVRLNQSLEQTLMQLKKSSVDPKVEENISVIRNEMKSIEKVLQGFTGVLRNLDVGLGKMSLIIEQVEKFDTEKIEDSMVDTKNHLDDILFEYGRVARSSENTDNLVVDTLKAMFESYSLMGEFDKNCESLLDGFREEELAKNVIFTGDVELEEDILTHQAQTELGIEEENLPFMENDSEPRKFNSLEL